MLRALTLGLTAVGLTACLIWPAQASAHLFGGPPFLSINGQDAQTNTNYLSGPSFAMPQDFAPSHYPVGQPILFKIDLTKLPVPLDVAQQSKFRWTWAEGDTNQELGTEMHHTYHQPGSYLVSLDVLPPGDQDYVLYDTVRVDVVSDPNYQRPKVEAGVVKDTFATKKPVKFVSQITTDPSASVKKITWDFGDGTTSTEANPVHTYAEDDFLRFVYVQVEDSHGFKVENGLTLTANSGNIEVTPLTASGSSVLMVDQSQSPHATSQSWTSWWPFITVGVIALLGLTFGWYYRKNKQPKNNPLQKP